MFNTPIQHKPLTSMKEVTRFSYRTGSYSEEKRIATQNNGHIAFSDEIGRIFVTPYRPEIWDILRKDGYTEKCTLSVPYSNGGEVIPVTYKWLVKIAEEENWASTYEEAAQVAKKKGIQPVKKVSKEYSVKEISSPYYDTETHTGYTPMTMKYLLNSSKENVGTYVLVNEHTLVVCDEYGRTFLLKTKGVVNDMVNSLINAGYTRTLHPEYYISEYKPEK